MKRARMGRGRFTVIGLAMALPLLIAGCSGSSEDQDGMPGRDEMMGYLREEIASSDLPPELADCIVNAMDGLSDEEIFSILEDTAGPELEQKVDELTSVCAE